MNIRIKRNQKIIDSNYLNRNEYNLLKGFFTDWKKAHLNKKGYKYVLKKYFFVKRYCKRLKVIVYEKKLK